MPTSSILPLVAFDGELDLFEGQYPIPEGVTYNSYLISDEKRAVMDAVDARRVSEWLNALDAALEGREPDYFVVSHLEPDHSGGMLAFLEKYPDAAIICSARAAAMLPQFVGNGFSERVRPVKEGDSLELGAHTLHFVMAPMVHWPEVMVSYESAEKTLFSADAFGTFGPSELSESWADEARRYYVNIVGKYGAQTQALLKKASALDIEQICPLHGPALSGDLTPYLEKYDLWSRCEPEDEGALVAFASIHGNTADAAGELARELVRLGLRVRLMDLSRCDLSEAVSQAFRFKRLALAACTYDAGLFTPMEDFLHRLKAKGFRGRTVFLIENGSWAPMAAKLMGERLAEMKDMTVGEPSVKIKTTLSGENRAQIRALAASLVKNQ